MKKILLIPILAFMLLSCNKEAELVTPTNDEAKTTAEKKASTNKSMSGFQEFFDAVGLDYGNHLDGNGTDGLGIYEWSFYEEGVTVTCTTDHHYDGADYHQVYFNNGQTYASIAYDLSSSQITYYEYADPTVMAENTPNYQYTFEGGVDNEIPAGRDTLMIIRLLGIAEAFIAQDIPSNGDNPTTDPNVAFFRFRICFTSSCADTFDPTSNEALNHAHTVCGGAINTQEVGGGCFIGICTQTPRCY